MPTTMTFDNASIADAIIRAARVAPTKGAEFDKAQGILIDCYPSQREVLIRSTDLSLHYGQRVKAADGKGESVAWRIPSRLLADYMAVLDKNEDATINFIDRGDGKIRLQTGNSFCAFELLNRAEYVQFPEFTTETLSPATVLAPKIDQVAWACDTGSQILKGVHLDGEFVVGCSQEALAVVGPCSIPMPQPVTVPLKSLSGLLRTASDVRLYSDGSRLYITLDDDTQTSAQLLEGDYPNYKGLMRDPSMYAGHFRAHRNRFLDALGKLMTFVKAERQPVLSLIINGSGLIKTATLDMEVPSVGRAQERVEVDMEWDGEPLQIFFKYSLLQNAIEHTRGDYFNFYFGHADDPTKMSLVPIRIQDEVDYISYLTVIKGR
jgi:DNA polymerase III sliding clamp (beta) subunit (PCNA family)